MRIVIKKMHKMFYDNFYLINDIINIAVHIIKISFLLKMPTFDALS